MNQRAARGEKSTPATADVIQDEGYFADLIERTKQGHAKKYRDQDVLEDPQEEFFRTADVAETIQWARMAFRLDTTDVADDRKMVEKYQNLLRNLRNFADSVGMGRSTFLRALDSELWFAEEAASGLASAGTARAAKNRTYNRAGGHIASVLSMLGLPYPNQEAAVFLWYNGGSELAEIGSVEVIDPFRGRVVEPGKDPRESLESEARKRWSYGTRKKGRVNEFGFFLARVMRGTRQRRRDNTR